MNPWGKKALALWAALCFLLIFFPPGVGAERRIGILLWNDEFRYLRSKEGILAQLAKEGLGPPSVTVLAGNAGESKAKLAELVRQFSAARVDLILPVGTVASAAVAKEIRDIPIVFTMVYDPVEAGIVTGLKKSGNTVTGASSRIPMDTVIRGLKEFTPVRKLAVLYTPGEKNSEVQLVELNKIQARLQVKVIPVILGQGDDVARMVPRIAGGIDALYLTGSSIVGAGVPVIVEAASRARVATVSHLADLVDRGALLGICVNPYEVGRLAGAQAAKVLKGIPPASIPVEETKRLDYILNMKTARAGQFTVPPKFRERVTRFVE